MTAIEHPQNGSVRKPSPGGVGLELAQGERIFLQLDNRSTVLAMIARADGDLLELELLDDLPESTLDTVTVVGVLISSDNGLFTWPAIGTAARSDSKATVTVTGAPRSFQRRQHPRFAVALPATVCVLRYSQSTASQPCRVVDLSRGGLKLICGPIDVGDTVLLSVELGDQPLELAGRVLLAYPDGHGSRVAHVAFLAPAGPSEPSRQFEDYLDRLGANQP